MERAWILKTDLDLSLGIAGYWLYDLGKLAMIPPFIFLSPHLAHMSLHVCYSLYTWGAPSVVVESDMHLDDYCLAWLRLREALAKGLGLVTQKWQVLSNLASGWLARREEHLGWPGYSPLYRISTSWRTSGHSLSHHLKRRWKRLSWKLKTVVRSKHDRPSPVIHQGFCPESLSTFCTLADPQT